MSPMLANLCLEDDCDFHCFEDSDFCSEHSGLELKPSAHDMSELTSLSSVPGMRFFTEFEVIMLKKHIEKVAFIVPPFWQSTYNIKPLAEALMLDSTPNVFLRSQDADVLIEAVSNNTRLDNIAKRAFDCVICSCVLHKWNLTHGVWRSCTDCPESKVALKEEIKRAVICRYRLTV